MGTWNIQDNLDSDLFWAGDGRFIGGFPPFCVFETRIQTCHYLDCTEGGVRRRILLKIEENLASLNPEKLQGFHGTFCTIVTPY